MGPRESLRRCQDEMTSANTADERQGAGGRMGLGWAGLVDDISESGLRWRETRVTPEAGSGVRCQESGVRASQQITWTQDVVQN